jgi:hypothetical protein
MRPQRPAGRQRSAVPRVPEQGGGRDRGGTASLAATMATAAADPGTEIGLCTRL